MFHTGQGQAYLWKLFLTASLLFGDVKKKQPGNDRIGKLTWVSFDSKRSVSKTLQVFYKLAVHDPYGFSSVNHIGN